MAEAHRFGYSLPNARKYFFENVVGVVTVYILLFLTMMVLACFLGPWA